MSQKKELLFLVHRIPYPPNKGDKIRSYNLLKHLEKTYRVHVGAFVDDPHDWNYQSELQELCGELKLLELKPRTRKLASLSGLITGQSLTVPYYANNTMQEWVDDVVVRNSIDNVVVFSSPMAQYVEGEKHVGLRRVADFVDIDSDKWRQYAYSKPWPVSWIYGREARTLLNFERKIAAEFDATVFVSDDESRMFQQMAPEAAKRVSAVHNGVDTDYFSPDHDYSNPYSQENPRLVFTGAMDYWANADAVRWFVEEIFPEIRKVLKDAEFYIVGARPAPEVISLAKFPGVIVTGAVHDIRPYISYAQGVVAPMRIARGVQNKVLEAMAMAKPVIATPEAAEGINATASVEFLVESGVPELVKTILDVLSGMHAEVGFKARQCVLQKYGWAQNLQCFNELLEGDSLTLNQPELHVDQSVAIQ